MRFMTGLLLLAAGCAGPAEGTIVEVDAAPAPVAAAPRAEIPAPAELTLAQAVAQAEASHPDLEAARARIRAAGGRSRQAGLFPNPDLVLRAETVPLEGGRSDEGEWVGGLSQRLPVGGRLGAAADAEEREQERLSHELEALRREIEGRVHAAFATALYAQAAAALQEESVAGAARGAAVVRLRREAGDALAEEEARAALEEFRARQEAERALSLRDQALVALAFATGDASRPIRSVAGSLDEAVQLPLIEELLARLAESPQRRSLTAEVDVAEARLDLARAERIPDLHLDLLYRRLGATDDDAFDVGLTVPLPLFDRNQGRVEEAEAAVEAARAKARSAANDLERRAREALARSLRAARRARLLKEEVEPRIEAVLAGAEARHAAGDLGLGEILALRRERREYRLGRLESLRELLESWAELKSLMGKR